MLGVFRALSLLLQLMVHFLNCLFGFFHSERKTIALRLR